MNKILKYILFRIALVVITLHAIIPHPHSDELTVNKHSEIHQKSNSLIGIIRLAFHESNDETLDNLVFVQYESVKKSDNNYPSVSVFNNTQSTVEIRETKNTTQCNTYNFDRLLFVKLNGLRGPPSLA